MRNKLSKRMILAGVALATVATPVLGFHRWSTYHWKKSSAEISPPLHDNVDSRWDSYLRTAQADWNKSTVIESALVPGTVNARRCPQVTGTIQVCNAAYGNNGWLGLASISLSNGHIASGTTKVNDSYYTTGSRYDTPGWRAAVMCQEIGHDYGLGHQDENSSDDTTNSCMEYTNQPDGNMHPDAHDYEELLTIYNHAESASTATYGGSAGSGADTGDTPREWGRAVGFMKDGRPNVFMRVDGPGRSTITHVYWAPGEGPRRGDHH